MQKIRHPVQGDLITFLASDHLHKALLCTSTHTDKSPYSYTFAALSYDQVAKPAIEDLLDSDFYGTGNTRNEFFKYSDQELAKMWSIHPEIEPYFLGSYGLIIWRKDFMQFRNNLELVTNIKIINNLDNNGNGSMNASSWSLLQDFFSGKYQTVLPGRGQKKFSVRSIVVDW